MNVTPLVRDYMDKKFITLTPDMDVYRAIEIMLDNKITGAAVVNEKENLVGILSEKDCLRVLVHGAYSTLPSGKVSEFMTRDVISITPDLDIFTVAERFFKFPFRRFLVTQNDKLVGQITRRDLLRVIRELHKKK